MKFSALRRRMHFSPATAIAIAALVFAMTGGAFAVTGSTGGQGTDGAKSTSAAAGRTGGVSALATESKAKSKSKTGARGPAGPAGKIGPTGPMGAQGSAGAQGPAGPQGPAGANGTDGANGTSVTTAAASTKECKEGGTTLTSASGTSKVCNGEKGAAGAPWPAGGTLPKKATEKGAWSIVYTASTAKEPGASAISFTIPLTTEPEAHYIREAEDVPGPTQAAAITEGKCSGTPADPEAASGNLCIFESESSNAQQYYLDTVIPAGYVFGTTANGSSVVVDSVAEGAVSSSGTWAVTG